MLATLAHTKMSNNETESEVRVDSGGTSPLAKIRLALENGAVFTGRSFGAHAAAAGEVVFNTAMCGYQEALSDPSYTGQILVMTASEIGNYGVNPDDIESRSIAVAGMVIRELSRVSTNHRAQGDLSSWLAGAGVPGMCDLDTRALVRMLRNEGAMRGVIEPDPSIPVAALVQRARGIESMAGCNLAGEVSPRKAEKWSEGLGDWKHNTNGTTREDQGRRVVLALDCGAKHNIYRHLIERGCEVRIAPHDLGVEEILSACERGEIDGLFVSNGPGDPAAVEQTIETLRIVAGRVPTFGICLGHQLLALALGASTYKLKFGHRGANQPVRNLLTGRIEITSQNHGFCVEEESLLAAGCEVTHRHLNDQTVAGFRHLQKPVFSVQYHPEASPGPHDSAHLFDVFVRMMVSGRVIEGQDFEMVTDFSEHASAPPSPA